MLHKNFIAGEWVEGTSTSRNINPSNLDDVVGEYSYADRKQAEDAIAGARAAFPGWRASTPQVRFDALDKIGTEILARKEELGRLLSREEGKTLPEGQGEVVRAGQIFKFFAGEALRITGDLLDSVRPGVQVEVTREPVGVVGLITPWNFPIAIPVVEDRAGARLRQLRGDQARRPRAGQRLGAWPTSSPARACRPACSTSSWAAARSWATSCSSRATSTPSASPARSRPGARWPRPALPRTRSSSSRWAARIRW